MKLKIGDTIEVKRGASIYVPSTGQFFLKEPKRMTIHSFVTRYAMGVDSFISGVNVMIGSDKIELDLKDFKLL